MSQSAEDEEDLLEGQRIFNGPERLRRFLSFGGDE